jgi:large subunit ribosomal protein L17
MRHRKTTPRLGRKPEARVRLLRNLVTSLILEERVTTSLAKAKAARSLSEKIITRGKKDTVHSRRMVARLVHGSKAVQKVFDELGPRYSERPGGYTRILRLGARKGDAAEAVILELVDSTRAVDTGKSSGKSK